MKRSKLASALRIATGLGLGIAALPFAGNALAQDEVLEEVIITGSRITQPGMVSSSPINSISETEIGYFQQPEIERIIKQLPGTIPGDGQNVNNGTAGAATIDLRGLGAERNLLLLNGRRMVPFNYDGEVDSASVPTALLERVDVITGGASAVYGSDAIAGAVNFVLKRDFEGVELRANRSQTSESDGEVNNLSITIGSNLAEDRGNIAFSASYMDREQVLLGQRPLGQLGIDTASGANFAEFLAGQGPLQPEAGCGGPNVVAAGGSTTSIPTRFAIVGAGAAASGQFREDRTLGTECSRFNFNPFNFYQTPMERYTATVTGHFDITEEVEAYSTINYTNTTVVQQVAPSGTFGATFFLPLNNALIGAQARQFMLDAGNAALAAGTLTQGDVRGGEAGANWEDVNMNGVVDPDDYLNVQMRRRTLELGPRTERYDSDMWTALAGVRADIGADWNVDASFQYGESNRTTVRDGYTNLTNIQNALDSTDGVTCNGGDATCVPIDLFGGFGTITDAMAGYARAIALQQQKYEQTILNVTFDGPVNFAQLPSADSPLALAVGYENRREKGQLEPDECLKLAPASCQGGAGGNLLPIRGGYKVSEFFFEGNLPLIDGAAFAESLNLEFGFRTADYDISDGQEETWKIGLNWRPVDSLMVRLMQQQATRAPNIGEIASPITTGLDNATLDPCSIANAGNINATLQALCISTGMTAAQVGSVQDIVSGQINILEGSNPANLPASETADTFTAGFVWTPDFEFFNNFQVSLDYYDIDIEDIIGEPSAQEILDGCYVAGVASECAKIVRVAGDLTLPASGVQLFTTNLEFKKAEGIEIGISTGFDIGVGELQVSANINKYLANEELSSALTQVRDCNGFFGTNCDPVSELRWIQRTTWLWDKLAVSLQWRHIGEVDIEPNEAASVAPFFQRIRAYDYFDFFASYNINDSIEVSLSADNIFDVDPPVLGNEAGDTSSNSGNTFPSNYDTMGRIYKLGIKASF
ncbi:MAG: TonB-dependent receptor [Pseudomonadota bacterium]